MRKVCLDDQARCICKTRDVCNGVWIGAHQKAALVDDGFGAGCINLCDPDLSTTTTFGRPVNSQIRHEPSHNASRKLEGKLAIGMRADTYCTDHSASRKDRPQAVLISFPGPLKSGVVFLINNSRR